MPQKTSANSTSRRAQYETPDEIAAERDFYRERAEKLEVKLDSVNRKALEAKAEAKADAKADAKAELKRLAKELSVAKESIDTYKKACRQLDFENDKLKSDKKQLEADKKQLEYEKEGYNRALVTLRASYESLKLKYDAIPPEERRRNPMVSTIPDRTKRAPGSSSSSNSNGGGSMSSRARQQEAERLDRERVDARLNARFERSDRSNTIPSRRPSMNGHQRRDSYIEGFGSRKVSGTTSRAVFDDVAHTSRYEEPVVTTRDPQVMYSQMPRTVPSSVGYRSGGSSAIVDDNYENGDYHAHPVQ